MFQRVSQHLERAGILSVTVPGVSHWNGHNSFRASEIIIQSQIYLINVICLYFLKLYGQLGGTSVKHLLQIQILSVIDNFAVSSLSLGMFPQDTGDLIISTFNVYILILRPSSLKYMQSFELLSMLVIIFNGLSLLAWILKSQLSRVSLNGFLNPDALSGSHFHLLWNILFFPVKCLWALVTISQLHLKYFFILMAF